MTEESDQARFDRLAKELKEIAKPASLDAERLINNSLIEGGSEHQRLVRGAEGAPQFEQKNLRSGGEGAGPADRERIAGEVDKAFDAALADGSVEKSRAALGPEKTTVNSETLRELGETPADGSARAAVPLSSVQQPEIKMAGQRISVGYLGEEMREQFVQANGEISLNDKLGFNQTNQPGIDGTTISIDSDGDLVLNLDDNKAYAAEGNVNSASAVQGNLGTNIEKLKAGWSELANNPSLEQPIRDLAQLAWDLADRWQIQIRITNGAGNSRGTTIPAAQSLNVNPQAQPGQPNHTYNRGKGGAPPPPAAAPTPPASPTPKGSAPPTAPAAAPTPPANPSPNGSAPPTPPAAAQTPPANPALKGSAPPTPPVTGQTPPANSGLKGSAPPQPPITPAAGQGLQGSPPSNPPAPGGGSPGAGSPPASGNGPTGLPPPGFGPSGGGGRP